KDLILEDYVAGILSELLEKYAAKDVHPEDWDSKGLKNDIFTRFGVDIFAEGVKPETLNRQELGDAIFEKLKQRYEAKEKLIGPEGQLIARGGRKSWAAATAQACANRQRRAAATDGRRNALPRRLTTWKRLFCARSARNWSRRAWPVPGNISRYSSGCVPAPR